MVSLDTLYNEKVVDKIQLYTYQGKNHILTYELSSDQWNYDFFPSEEVIFSREEQLKNKEIIEGIIKKGDNILDEMNAEIKDNFIDLLNELDDHLRNLE